VKAYLIGHSARDFALELADTPHEICETMERAVARAAEEATAGETVLLAPAAASFDQYPNFEKRGEDFAERVRALAGVDPREGTERCFGQGPVVIMRLPTSSPRWRRR
jgi:UDP-N-acetylmuramoylalanine--D-glutamate ligase